MPNLWSGETCKQDTTGPVTICGHLMIGSMSQTEG